MDTVTSGDFNADGRPDLALSAGLANSVRVLLNTSTPAIESEPANLTFTTQPLGTLSAVRPATVFSTGDRALRPRAITAVGPASHSFLIAGDTCTGAVIPPGGTCSFACALRARACRSARGEPQDRQRRVGQSGG